LGVYGTIAYRDKKLSVSLCVFRAQYTNVKAIISQEDILLICQDYKLTEVMQRKLFGTPALKEAVDHKPLKNRIHTYL
jgi:hypothetical protein